jgi:hypothetical protein
VSSSPRSAYAPPSAAEVPDSDVADDVAVGPTEHRAASDLDATIGRVVLVDENARPRVSAEVAHLHVVAARHDVEAAVSPAVPDRREEYVAVGAVGREDGDEGTLEQPVEVVGAEALSHRGESSHAWPSGQLRFETLLRPRRE